MPNGPSKPPPGRPSTTSNADPTTCSIGTSYGCIVELSARGVCSMVMSPGELRGLVSVSESSAPFARSEPLLEQDDLAQLSFVAVEPVHEPLEAGTQARGLHPSAPHDVPVSAAQQIGREPPKRVGPWLREQALRSAAAQPRRPGVTQRTAHQPPWLARPAEDVSRDAHDELHERPMGERMGVVEALERLDALQRAQLLHRRQRTEMAASLR